MSSPAPIGVSCNYKKILFPVCPGLDPEKLVVSAQGIFSVTPATHSNTLCDIITSFDNLPSDRPLHVVDMTACNGGDTLAFALRGMKVTSFEQSATEFPFLQHNVQQYHLNIRERITLYQKSSISSDEDGISFPEELTSQNEPIDIVYFDPPWGGKDFRSQMKSPGYDLLLTCDNDEQISAKDCIVACFQTFPTLRWGICKVPPGFNFESTFPSSRISFKKHDILVFTRLILDD